MFLGLGLSLTCRGNIIKILQVVIMSRSDRVIEIIDGSDNIPSYRPE